MSEDENLWKWKEFVEIGNTIHKMRGVVRIDRAKDALGFADNLRQSGYLLKSKERYELYKTLHSKIAQYLDGNAEVIQDAVEKYFLLQHCKAGLDESLFRISFFPKGSGVQTGFICRVNNGTQTVRYYIKTHQSGPTQSNVQSMGPPDTKEMFIYTILHYIGLGPLPYFIIPIHGTKKTLYIATKDCELVLLSHLTNDTVINKALLQLDLISRILCLRDCATNSSNCGQVKGKAMIVDFRIENQPFGYAKPDILDNFYAGNGEYQYSGLMRAAVLDTPNAEKLVIMKDSLVEWNLLENIERAKMEIDELVRRWQEQMTFANDLQTYIEGIKATVAVLINVAA